MSEMRDAKLVEIPLDIYPDEVVENLEKGLGYRVRRLGTTILWLNPPDSSLPELIISGNQIMLNDEQDDAQRLVDLIQTLQKRRGVI